MIDLTGRTDIPVAEDVLAELTALCERLGVRFLIIGAAARDLVIHAQQNRRPVRATHDIDIAVGIRADEQFAALASSLPRPGGALHKFSVLGVDVDVVPLGEVERGRTIRFADDHLLDVNGLQEAYSTSIQVTMPKGTAVRAASPAAQTALKILAWRDRHLQNRKDALDLATILSALADDPFVNEVWDDLPALDATGDDIFAAAAYHYGHAAAAPFAPNDGAAVLHTLDDAALRPLLVQHMNSSLASAVVDGYRMGFAAGLGQ